jgi:hypothetical protein
MNDVTMRVGKDERIETSIFTFDLDTDRWCFIRINSDQCKAYLRFESHASSLHLLDALRFRLEEASRYLRGGKQDASN